MSNFVDQVETIALRLRSEYEAEGGFQVAFRSEGSFWNEAFEIARSINERDAASWTPAKIDEAREDYLCSFE